MKRLNKETWRDRFRRKFMQGFCKVENCHGCSADRREMEKIEKFIADEIGHLKLSSKNSLNNKVILK